MNTLTPITTTHLRRSVATGAAAVALFGFATLALASGDDPLKVTVNYADLDVSHPAGAVVLYRRIRAAAKQVCSPLESRGIEAAMQLHACIEGAVLDAVNAVNQPALTSVLDAKRLTSPSARLVSQVTEGR
jgi:UrcA family protein